MALREVEKSPVSILIVADDASTRESLQVFLESKGHTDVFCATSGEEVFGLLGRARTVDAVLLDADLAGLDGIETCRRIKAAPDFRDLPVVILTAGAVEPT